MIRILLDQGVPRTTAFHLQDEKWDILHVGDIGLSKAKDTELIEYARENGRIIITLDSDFHAFLAVTNADSPSVMDTHRRSQKSGYGRTYKANMAKNRIFCKSGSTGYYNGKINSNTRIAGFLKFI